MSLNDPTDGGRLLVVDDDPSVRALLADVLTDEGFQVTAAENGAEALAIMEHDRPDVILLDLSMPVMDGRTFYRHIRGNGATETPTIIVSAVGAKRAQRELGADGAIAKPFDLDQLVAEIERLVRT